MGVLTCQHDSGTAHGSRIHKEMGHPRISFPGVPDTGSHLRHLFILTAVSDVFRTSSQLLYHIIDNLSSIILVLWATKKSIFTISSYIFWHSGRNS